MILVDSDVLIAHLRGRAVARDWLVETRRSSGQLAVSVVSIAEITGGVRPREHRDVTRLLASFHPLPIDDAVARQAGAFRRDFHRSHAAIGIADYLIAATAHVRGCRLATLNVRHFPMLAGLRAPFQI